MKKNDFAIMKIIKEYDICYCSADFLNNLAIVIYPNSIQ